MVNKAAAPHSVFCFLLALPFAINAANKLTDAAGAIGLDRFLECLGWLAGSLRLEGSQGAGTSVVAIFTAAAAAFLSSVGKVVS